MWGFLIYYYFPHLYEEILKKIPFQWALFFYLVDLASPSWHSQHEEVTGNWRAAIHYPSSPLSPPQSSAVPAYPLYFTWDWNFWPKEMDRVDLPQWVQHQYSPIKPKYRAATKFTLCLKQVIYSFLSSCFLILRKELITSTSQSCED